MSGGPQPHMIPIVPGDPGLTGRTPLAERVERHMADKGDPHGTMVMVNEAIRGFIKNEADPLFSDWLAKHNVVEVETDPVFTEWVNRSNVRLGEGSSATSATAIALGCNAKCSADGSVQLGDGTNLTRTSLQFRNANLFVQGSGSVAALGTGFPRASASAYGAVKIGSGLKVVDGVVSSDAQPNVIETVKVDGVPLHVSDDKSVDIRSTGMISDSAGNVIRADGSAVVVDGSWTCNGVLLTKKEGRDYWENAEMRWGLGYDPSAKWAFTNGTGGYARSDAPADATKLSFVIGGVTYDATIGRADSVVMSVDAESMKRYSVVRPEASGNTYQLSDFAVNVVDLPSSGEYTFTFPPRTGGRVRDFVLKLNVTADPLPTVQFVKHPTDNDPPRFEGADGWSELELGVNFFGFTETS